MEIKNVKVQCYKCKKWAFIDVTDKTKYWICPNCNSLNGVEKLIKQILIDTILPDKVRIEKE